MPGPRARPSGPGHPLPADLVVVDESSMLNLRLAEVLLGGLAESTHVVFVGDADQLPPIGAGKPFEDLIDAGIVPVVRLTQIFRQAARSMITTAAHEINQGRPPHLEPERRPGARLLLHRPARRRSGRWRRSSRWSPSGSPAGFGVDPIRDVQVLAPMYRGAVGIDALNERLQERLNPEGAPRPQRALPDRRPADPDPQLARAGPDERLDRLPRATTTPTRRTIVVDTDDGGSLHVPYGETATLRLAYAISVHKAQGCEVPVVVGVCHRSHSRMLTRPLLYTAITRARSTCVLVGDRGALAMAVRRDDGGSRFSSLGGRLAE